MTKELYFVDTLESVKYNKTLEALPLCIKYIALDESLMTNIVLGFASCYICHSTITFIRTGSSALSNTSSKGLQFVHIQYISS